MDTDLSIVVRRAMDVPVLDLSGDLDAFTCGKLREAIIHLIEHGEPNVVVSLANVNYIDSSGLGTLVGGLHRLKEQNGGLALSNVSPQVAKVLNITGLHRVFSLYDDDTQAVSSFAN